MPDSRDAARLFLLVLRCQSGDREAFAKLHDEFADRTMRYLRGTVGDDAGDVQQELWMGVYRTIAELSNPGAFRTWLFRVTRHRAVDAMRRQRRTDSLLVDASSALVDSVAAKSEEILSVDPVDIERILSTLSPVHREVLILRYLDDLSYEEIATVVGCAVGTVKSRIHNARQCAKDAAAANRRI